MSSMFPISPGSQEKTVNPCVKAFGPDRDNRTCKSCAKLRHRGIAKKYLQCVLRGDVPGRDHRASWPACSKYVRNPEVEESA
jgi:hypothetical protein